MTDSMLTSEAANTNEGQAASQVAQSTAAEGDAPLAATQSAQATEGQTAAEGQKAEATGETADDQAKTTEKVGAPEQYEFTAQEGQAFDPQVLAEFSDVARELDLSQDAAQKILDKVAPALQARQAEVLEAARTEWANSAKSDKEFGGDKLDENLATAKKALDTFGTPELRTLLNNSGLGNHPEVIRLMYRAGKAISEDTFVGGANTNATPARRDAATALYPTQQKT